MSKQAILGALALSALLAGGTASADPERAARAAATRAPDPALGMAIALQGDAALKEIRADAERAVRDSLHLPELTPPATEMASAGGGERSRDGAGR